MKRTMVDGLFNPLALPILQSLRKSGKRQYQIKLDLIRWKLIKSSKISINYHMSVLKKAGLVVSNEHLYIRNYTYSLTDKGKTLLSKVKILGEFLQSNQD